MGKSNRLTEWEVRDVMRLVREVCELGDDPVAWRRHSLDRLCRMLGASAGMAYVHPLPMDPTRLAFDMYLQNGAQTELDRYIGNGNFGPDPCTPEITKHLGASFCVYRAKLVRNREWYGSAFFNEIRRPCRSDDTLCSHVNVPALRRLNGFGFARCLGDRTFGEREARLLTVFHEELEQVWAAPPLRRNGTFPDLSPRMVQTLALVMQGLGRKQIASRLAVSIHTVHDYMKALHTRFECASTMELVNKARAHHRKFVPAMV